MMLDATSRHLGHIPGNLGFLIALAWRRYSPRHTLNCSRLRSALSYLARFPNRTSKVVPCRHLLHFRHSGHLPCPYPPRPRIPLPLHRHAPRQARTWILVAGICRRWTEVEEVKNDEDSEDDGQPGFQTRESDQK